MDLRLENGSRVCIVGGGPAGSFAALHLLNLAQQIDLNLEIVIFDPRDFHATGRQGCKGCAGILSSRLLAGLDSLGLSLPDEVIQSELHSYAAYINGDVFHINQPDPRRRIVSVYRGSGPQRAVGARLAGFDNYILTQACARGARYVPDCVNQITYTDKPVVHTSEERVPADLLVLATGVNGKIQLAPEFGYLPPKTKKMVHGEMTRPLNWCEDEVRIYFKGIPGMIFGALTPKGRYLNISMFGDGLTQRSIARLIEGVDLSADQLSKANILCSCLPQIAISAARIYYGSRWVAVGDAAVSRLYKDGIGSAFFSSQIAMQAAIQNGISDDSFRRVYAPYCRSVDLDNKFGRLFMWLWTYVLRNPRLLAAWKNAIRFETDLPIDQRIHTNNLWGLFTGDAQYQELFRQYLSPLAMRHLWRGLFF
jgi:flavin-dependent dehydrogenase